MIDEETDEVENIGLEFYEVDDEKITNIINNKIDYVMGRVPEKNKKKGRD